MNNGICFGETYCHSGIPILKTRIQLPAVSGGQPTDIMLSLAKVTEQYAVQTLLPAVRASYDSLDSVAEKMHFEPYEYRHIWHAEPHPGSPGSLIVRIETELTHGRGGAPLRRTERVLCMDGKTGRFLPPGRRRSEKRGKKKSQKNVRDG